MITASIVMQVLDKQIACLEAEHLKEVLYTRRSSYTRVADSNTQSTLLELKYQRNAHVPLLMLPDEILLEISHMVKGGNSRSPKVWHHVVHVCRRWRSVVLDCPTFWTNPSPYHPEYALLALERSKTAPLDVTIFTSEILPTLLKHMGRMQTLTIVLTRIVLERAQNILLDLCEEASLLTNLSISQRPHPGPSENVTLNLAAFRTTSSLRRLALSNIKLDWGIFPLPSLTELSLEDISVVTAVTGDRFVHALGQMPHLNSFELSFNDIELHKYPSTSASNQITLSHLNKLVIREAFRHQSEGLLAQATLPELRWIDVDWEPETTSSDIEWRPGTLSQISSTIKFGQFPVLDELEIDWDSFRLFPSRSPQSAHVIMPFPFIRFDRTAKALIVNEIISTLASTIIDKSGKFSALVKVSLVDDLGINAVQLTELFGSLPRLQVIGVSNVPLLTMALEIKSNHPRELPLPFTMLESIEWHYVGTDEDGRPVGLNCVRLDEFITCIMQRCEYGSSIHCLKLLGSFIPWEQRVCLEEVFVSVI